MIPRDPAARDRSTRWPSILVTLGVIASFGCSDEPPGSGERTYVALSPPFHVERIYKSMEGPLSNATFSLGEGPPQIVWITGYRTEVVAEDGTNQASPEFMCHNNLVFDAKAHGSLFGTQRSAQRARLFTASQGQFGIELPEGFGIPVLTNETLGINTQVLNHNIENPDVKVRHRISIDWVADAEARGVLEPLFPSMAYVMASLDEGDLAYGVEHPDAMQEGAACMPGDVAPQASTMDKSVITDRLGRKFTGHWVVPPGREVRRTLVTDLLEIPFDTTVHYIAVHLHPFAETLELRDLTTGDTIFTSHARGPDVGVGLTEVEYFSSVEGIPIYADHEYEMISTYDNTSGVDQDAMATFFLYLHDSEAESGLEALRQRLGG
jgi:hypothetical protein